ncbi:TMV resistance protein N-like [Bidens hawaiensis]|uniref:TMV resistance protein N-like n=1 Tax=Bidens hawaiensis TaxID=980011 RepID=UPI0040495785
MENYTTDTRGSNVIPIFHGVEPSEVRSQTGYYGEALAKHKLNNKIKREVNSWTKALATAASLSGWDMTNGNTTEHIQKIVTRISSELLGLMQHSKPSAETSADTGLIGIDARTQELKSLLEVGTGGVLKVGISGMWGSGKSTLVSSVYDTISYKFEGCSFVKNVRDRSRMHGLKMLQEEILSDVLKLKVTLSDNDHGINLMETRLCQNSVLIVLDDVDHTDHLEMLVGSDEWFVDGSRIIFTTRNQDLVNTRSSLAHNVRMLDVKEAVELFSRRAFGKSAPAQGFEEVSQNMVSKFGGNPSALIRLGSFLHGKHINEWTGILNRLEGRLINEILDEFKTPDDGLARKFFPTFVTEGEKAVSSRSSLCSITPPFLTEEEEAVSPRCSWCSIT